jgi:peptidyl-prolyl cis-trans isomerase B (cyclophilin B)
MPGTPAMRASPRTAALALVLFAIAGAGVFFLMPARSGKVAHPVPPSKAPPLCANEAPKFMLSKYLRDKPYPMSIDPSTNYRARIATSCGTMYIDLLPGQSPNAVNNFVNLSKAHWFNAEYFFRISKDPDYVRVGDPTGTGEGGPGYAIPGDPPGDRGYDVGALAMWNDENGRAGSQFIIITGPDMLDQLPPGLTVFGTLSDDASLRVAQKIDSVPTRDDVPVEKVWILGVRIDEKGSS